MQRSTFLTLRGIIALAYAIPLLLIPGPLLALYGITPGPEVNLMSGFLGVELIAVGLLCLFSRNLTAADSLRAIMGSLLVAELIGLVLAVIGTLSSVFNPLGWSIALIYGTMSLGYIYFLFLQDERSGSLSSA